MALVLGIDDAGRGPLIGPMILAGVLMQTEDEDYLKKQGVDDSKKLEQGTRVHLAKIIESTVKNFFAVKALPEEIDNAIISGMNLNTLEAMKMAEVINNLNTKRDKIKVIVDCPSVNTKVWRAKLLEFIKNPNNLEVVCEHKADANYVAVSAASIIAKVLREEEVAKIKEKVKDFGNPGSGYPSDPSTKLFLKKHGKALADSGLFRKSWATWKELFPEAKQSTLFLTFL